VDGCRRLWCEVISHQWKGALPEVYRWCQGRNIDKNARLEVRRCQEWFGSVDYYRICEMAGVDASAILNEFRAVTADISKYRGAKDAKRG